MKNINVIWIIILVFLIILAAISGLLRDSDMKLVEKTEQYIEECEKGMGFLIEFEKYKHENDIIIKELDETLEELENIRLELVVIKHQLNEYKENSAKYFTNRYEITNYELEMIYKMVEAETTGGKSDSKVNVAHVIFNRIYSDQFPNTIEEVLFQRNAFSPVYDGRYYTVGVTQLTIDSVNAALNGLDTTQDSTFFMYRAGSAKKNSTWFEKNLEFVMKDSIGHEFFKIK